jgi:hypothetical protein
MASATYPACYGSAAYHLRAEEIEAQKRLRHGCLQYAVVGCMCRCCVLTGPLLLVMPTQLRYLSRTPSPRVRVVMKPHSVLKQRPGHIHWCLSLMCSAKLNAWIVLFGGGRCRGLVLCLGICCVCVLKNKNTYIIQRQDFQYRVCVCVHQAAAL